MKTFILSTIILISISCERNDCCVQPKIELSGVFEHQIPDCDIDKDNIINCVEWLEFRNDTEVDLLYGGGDIVHRFTYTQGADFVSLEGPSASSFKPTFIIKSASELERTDNGDIWKKK